VTEAEERDSLPHESLEASGPSTQSSKSPQAISCPNSGSTKLYRDGLRYIRDGSSVQRWLCRNCGYRFTDPNHKAKTGWRNLPSGLNLPFGLFYSCQGNDDPVGRVPSARKAATTLATVEKENEKRAAGAIKQITDSRGKIVEYLWYLKKQGRSEITITGYRQRLFQMLKEGIDLLNPNAVKEYLAKKSCSNRTKAIDVCIYDGFLKFLKMSWDPPIYKPERTLPFIPTEQEIDQLIAAVGRRLAVFLQLLKETGMRCGEAARLKWIDIDFERKTIRVTPEKGSDPRILPISDKLVEMLKNIPKKSEQVFSATLDSISSNFYLQRKKTPRKNFP